MSTTDLSTADPLSRLTEAGVAVWLDDLSRDRLNTGGLADLMERQHVVGVTTNPTIFAAAVASGSAYDEQLADLRARGVSVDEAVRMITTADVRRACDVLRPTYDATDALDGRVSIEVDPGLACDTQATIAEARALWWLVDRPNLYIKIPATMAGLPAISQCLSEGISVNVTLIFSLERYEAVMAAYLDGLERRHAAGGSLDGLGSVASFFISRVDTEVDRRLAAINSPVAAALRGTAALANARCAYQRYEQFCASNRWATLAAAGARPQRPLWASTGTKDPSYPDTRYVVGLVAPGTVNTMPETTLLAVADHGDVTSDTVRGYYSEARRTLDDLTAVGVSYDDVVDTLESEGLEKFSASWSELVATVTAGLASSEAQT
jgi:transaldolase